MPRQDRYLPARGDQANARTGSFGRDTEAGAEFNKLVASTVAFSVITLGAGLAITSLPAYATVTSSDYTIGTPTTGVSAVAVTPVSVSASALTNFQVTFTAATTLSGASGATINVVLSSGEDFVTAPASVDLTGGSCIQSANGGATSVAGFSVILLGTCTINAGSSVNIYFSAEAPATVGTFFLKRHNLRQHRIRELQHRHRKHGRGAADVGVFQFRRQFEVHHHQRRGHRVLAGPTSTITLTAFPTGGSTEALTFYNGPAGYTVTYTPSGGAGHFGHRPDGSGIRVAGHADPGNGARKRRHAQLDRSGDQPGAYYLGRPAGLRHHNR